MTNQVEYLVPVGRPIEMISKDLAAKQARDLAVSYEAFHSAHHLDDWSSVFIWATVLLRAQEAAGVTLLTSEHLRNILDVAKSKLDLDDRFRANDGR